MSKFRDDWAYAPFNDWDKENTEKIEKMKKEEFDVDTGTYMEDVHANDFVGVDADGNGLIDNVEELLKKADREAEEYNDEQDRLNKERGERECVHSY